MVYNSFVSRARVVVVVVVVVLAVVVECGWLGYLLAHHYLCCIHCNYLFTIYLQLQLGSSLSPSPLIFLSFNTRANYYLLQS